MAYNVFGNPITNSTLEGMHEYHGETITRTNRAHVALNMKNTAEKDVNVRKYVENLKARWGTGVSTLCLLYNATGDTVTFVTSHDWRGHIGPAPYPIEIANGQWGGFLHVKTPGKASGSSAAVVYHGKNEAGDGCDWMASWCNPWDRKLYNNTAYTEIREAGHFDNTTVWDVVCDKLFSWGHTHADKWNGCLSTVTTGSDTSPIYEGILTLEGAATVEKDVIVVSKCILL
ncbi:hypothetical protein QJS10_CPB21g01718 [Acorus calamus]|uniref:23 kDa jasmonate-induced protein-like n=1 Tax=Acorus calamus TaxID=4465 RepID=A0AAV9C639_ACOCL|nr:hypothetical protein QJS10_CPB21g01718 [Acorus calamus]